MAITIASLIKRLVAILATKRFEARMPTNVVQHVALLVELLVAHVARENLSHSPCLRTSL